MRLLTALALTMLTVVMPAQAQVPVSGYVLGLDAGNMLTGADVRLLDEFGLALEDRPVLRTDEQGRFLFNDVPAGEYMLAVTHTYATEDGPLQYEVRTDRFPVSDEPPTFAIALSQAGALLERHIKEGRIPVPLDESVWVRRRMLSPQVKRDQPGAPIHPVNVVSTEVVAAK
jgi:hypothetical protein